MRFVPIIARILFGFIYFGSGVAGLLNLIPTPTNLPDRLQTFMTGIMATGYFFPLLKGTETVFGLLLLLGYFVPLSLVVLAPVTLHILMVHTFMAPEGLVIAGVLVCLQVYLSFFVNPYKQKILNLFQPK